MSFVSALRSAVGRIISGGKYEPSRWRSSDSTFDDLNWIDQTWSSPSATGLQINQQTAMSCAAVMACVSVLAEDVSKLPVELWSEAETGARRKIKAHPVAKLLRQPNAWQTWMEFAGQMMLGLLLRGNAYAVIVRYPNGDPAYLVAINPDRVALWESPDGSLFWMVTRAGLHETAVLASQPLLIPDYNIFHLKGLSANGLLGFSKISLNREAIGVALGLEQQAARWLGNRASNGGVLMTDQKLTQDVADRVKADWQGAQSGLINAGKTAVLEMGLKWQSLKLTAQDVDYIASRNFQKEEIAAIWRVPPHMIGIQSRGQNQNITQQSQDYFNNTLSTYTQIWKSRIAFTFGLDAEELEPDFDRSILLEGDIVARFQMYRTGLQGVISTNEARKFEKLGPALEGDDIPAGDKVFRPVNMAAIDSDVFQGVELPNGQKPAAVGSDQTGDPQPGAGAPNKSDPDPDQDPPV
jgi:HK97 family phage portal protein